MRRPCGETSDKSAGRKVSGNDIGDETVWFEFEFVAKSHPRWPFVLAVGDLPTVKVAGVAAAERRGGDLVGEQLSSGGGSRIGTRAPIPVCSTRRSPATP